MYKRQKDAREKLNEQFMKDHPNVTVNYTTLTQAQFNETMLSGIRAGDAPDLFPLPCTVTFSTACLLYTSIHSTIGFDRLHDIPDFIAVCIDPDLTRLLTVIFQAHVSIS